MSTGKSRFEGTEEIFLSEKTHTNKITGFIPLPYFLFTVEGQGKRLISRNLSTDDKTNEVYLTPNTPLIQLWCAQSKWIMDLKIIFFS